ncbi:MAG: class B sortase [Anaerotruncus sp.]|nr:class B sortase [Anaerotruncus sp.]
MKLLKFLLRGIYFFFVGVTASIQDFASRTRIPRAISTKLAAMAMAACFIGGGWGVVHAVNNTIGDQMERGKEEQVTRVAAASASSEDSSSESSQEQSSSSKSTRKSFANAGSSSSKVDSIASATKYKPVDNDKLDEAISERAKEYQAGAKTSEGINIANQPKSGDIEAWQKLNSDVKGWLSIPGTNINYPVVIGAYTDYYTNRGYYKEASRNGVIWLDSDTKFNSSGKIISQNAVIYGHNWTNCWRPTRIGSAQDVMLAQLAAYDHSDFAAEHPYIYLNTIDGEHKYQVFTVFYTDLSFGYNYADGSRVPNIISTAKSKSIHKFDVSMGKDDQFLTLSTCTRVLGNHDNQRFVVMAKKIS